MWRAARLLRARPWQQARTHAGARGCLLPLRAGWLASTMGWQRCARASGPRQRLTARPHAPTRVHTVPHRQHDAARGGAAACITSRRLACFAAGRRTAVAPRAASAARASLAPSARAPQRLLGLWAAAIVAASMVVFWFAGFGGDGGCSRLSAQYFGLPQIEVRACMLWWAVLWCAGAARCRGGSLAEWLSHGQVGRARPLAVR